MSDDVIHDLSEWIIWIGENADDEGACCVDQEEILNSLRSFLDEIARLRSEVERLKDVRWSLEDAISALSGEEDFFVIKAKQIDAAWDDPVELHHGDDRYIKASAIGIVECPECEGLGEFPDSVQAWDIPDAPVPECEHCHGHGWIIK